MIERFYILLSLAVSSACLVCHSHRHNVTRRFAFCGIGSKVKSVCGAFSSVLERATEISAVNCIIEFQKSIYFIPFTENEPALHSFSATYASIPIVTLAPCQPVAVPAAQTTSTSFFHHSFRTRRPVESITAQVSSQKCGEDGCSPSIVLLL